MKRVKKISALTMMFYLLMIIVNVLANTIPINGVTTEEVATRYANLFTPAPYTFSIWGLIYLLLGIYTIYQLIVTYKNDNEELINLLFYVNVYLILSFIANSLWIIAWHYDKIGAALLLMFVILMVSINIHCLFKRYGEKNFNKIRIPFSIYFGWITIATIANIVTFLVYAEWSGHGISEQIWTVIVLLLGLVISVMTMIKFKDPLYGLTVVWAYMGILVKHISKAGYGFEYHKIVITVSVCIIVLLFACSRLITDKIHQLKI